MRRTGPTPIQPGTGSPPAAAARARCKLSSAFTLIEVVLAILIAMGLLLVVLFYYSQAANLRTQLLIETERLATLRLLMDRLTSDLRSARSDFSLGIGLTGDATSLTVLSAGLPSAAAWQVASSDRTVHPEADLRRIRYGAATRLEETNILVIGLVREEQPLAAPRAAEEIFADLLDPLFLEAAEPLIGEPLTDAIRFIRFRYWNGSAWSDAWSAGELPQGVEVTFGAEPLPEDLLPEEYPYEMFRRVIYLPGSGVRDDFSWLELLEEFDPADEAELPAEPSLEGAP